MSAARRAWQKLAGWWHRRQAALAGEARWLARQVRHLDERVKAAEARSAILEAEIAALMARLDSVTEGVRRSLASAAVPVPECVTADSPTQPILRVV